MKINSHFSIFLVIFAPKFDNFLSKEVKIIVGGTKCWETDETFRVLSRLEKISDVNQSRVKRIMEDPHEPATKQ